MPVWMPGLWIFTAGACSEEVRPCPPSEVIPSGDLLNPGSVFMIWLSEQLDECVYPENARREPSRILADLQRAQLCFELGLCKAELLLCNRGRLPQRSGWHSSSLIKTYFSVSLPGSPPLPRPAPVSLYIPTPALKEMWFEFRGFPLP